MKFTPRILALLALLVLFCTCALADDVPVYWQLERIEVSASTANSYGPAAAETDVVAFESADAREMIETVRDVSTIQLDVSRSTTGTNAHADYTFSGVPALVPGSACARLTLTADTTTNDDSLYLYTSVYVDGSRTLRIRNTGAWVHRVYFPRTSEEGTVRKVEIFSRESHEKAAVRVVYTYTAHPGVMIIDTNGDIVLYDLEGN